MSKGMDFEEPASGSTDDASKQQATITTPPEVINCYKKAAAYLLQFFAKADPQALAPFLREAKGNKEEAVNAMFGEFFLRTFQQAISEWDTEILTVLHQQIEACLFADKVEDAFENTDSFEKMVKRIRRLESNASVPVRKTLTPLPDNYRFDLDDEIDAMIKRGQQQAQKPQ